jgi:hypothetical protein
MKTSLTKPEKEFFKRHNKKDSKTILVVIAVSALLVGGLILDALNGFWILREAKSVSWGLGGIFLLSIFYLIGEVGSEWISSKDKVTLMVLINI